MDLNYIHMPLPLIASSPTLIFHSSPLNVMSNSLPNIFSKMCSKYKYPKLELFVSSLNTMFPLLQAWLSPNFSFQQMTTPLSAKNSQLLASSLPSLSSSHLTSNVLFASKIYSIRPLFSISSTSLVQATIISPADEMQQLTSGSPYCCSHPPSHNLLSRQQSKWVFKRCKSDHVTPLLTTFWRFPIILKIKSKLLIAV